MWPVAKTAGINRCCFISLIGEISENKAKTKDPTEKLNIGLNSPLFFNSLIPNMGQSGMS